jgi:hypothetical protein
MKRWGNIFLLFLVAFLLWHFFGEDRAMLLVYIFEQAASPQLDS